MRFTEDTGWDAFVASLDPMKLEAERMRPPKPGERPGSAADRAMRQAHQWAVEARRRPRSISGEEFVALLDEASEYDAAAGRSMPRLTAFRNEMRRKAS